MGERGCREELAGVGRGNSGQDVLLYCMRKNHLFLVKKKTLQVYPHNSYVKSFASY